MITALAPSRPTILAPHQATQGDAPLTLVVLATVVLVIVAVLVAIYNRRK